MRLIFLGTSSVHPTPKRNHQAILLKYAGEFLLFDCGEGTQRQMRIAKINSLKINKIFLSHWHGDHVLGLPGLLQTMAMNHRRNDLEIFGPKESKKRFDHMMKAYESPLPYKITIHEVAAPKIKKITENLDYEITAMNLNHSDMPCIGFCFKEKDKLKINLEYLEKFGLKKDPIMRDLQEGKDIIWNNKKIKAKDATIVQSGKKITFVMDTSEIPEIIEFAKNSDVFVCEATFMNDLKDKAKETGHLTSKISANLAKKAKVKKLILTHFSQRYKSITPLLKEAIGIFKETIAAEDFMEFAV